MNLISPRSSLPVRSIFRLRTPCAGAARTVSFAAALFVLGLSCASDPPPRPAKVDPSNTAAPESKPIGVTAAVAPSPGVASSGASTKDVTKPDVTDGYTCPMHPEVFSPTPGRCPKCGMTLVPRGNDGQRASDQHDGGGATP